MNQEETLIAATLPRNILILISEHVYQWDLSDAQFWISRRRLLRSMVRVNKYWVRKSSKCAHCQILRAGSVVECSPQ